MILVTLFFILYGLASYINILFSCLGKTNNHAYGYSYDVK